jgi:ribose transport system substrate-binding protein
MLRKMFVFLSIVLVFTFVLAACGTQATTQPAADEPAEQQAVKPAVAVQVLTTEIEYFEQLRQAYIKAAEAAGIDIETSDAQGDPQKQVNFIENAVTKKPTAIVLSLVDAATSKPAIEDAIKQGVPVIVQGQEEQDFPYATGNIGYSEETMGKYAGELVVSCLKEKFPDVTEYNGVSCQWPDWPSTVRRDAAAMKAVEDGVAPAKVNWVLKQKCGTRDLGLQTVEAALQKAPDLHFVVGVNDGSSIGAVAAYESAGIDPKTRCIAGPNNDSEVRPYVADGKVYGTVDLNHQGLADGAMALVTKLANGESVPKMTYIDMIKVTKDNIGKWLTGAEQPAEAAKPVEGKKYVIGVSNSFVGSEWRAQMIKNMEEAAKELGIELVIESADTDVQGQIQQINNLVNRGVDAIIINPGDQKGLNAALEDAVAQGVVVIAVDQQIPAEGVYNVTIDQKEWAKISAKWLFDKIGGNGNCTLIEGFVGHPANEDRMQGVDEVLAEFPDIKVVGRDTGMWDPATAQKVAANFLASLPDIDCMWTQDGMAEGQLLAVKAANPDPWPMVAGEARASFLREWAKTLQEKPGFETIGVVNPPGVGADGLRIAYEILNGGKVDPSKLTGPWGNSLYMPIPGVVTNENLQEWLTKIEGLPDSYTLDGLITQEDAKSYMQP